MVHIFQVEVDSSNIIVIDSVLNVLKIVMSHWHTELEKLLVDSLLRVLELISELIILGFKLFSKSHFSHFVIDLSQLLHLKVMLTDQVLLLLSEVSEVPSWRAGIDLA